MKADDPEQRFKNALIYGTSHPEIYMTKADELWEKYSEKDEIDSMTKHHFLAALAERDAYVKKECVRVCREKADWNKGLGYHGHMERVANDCAAAIEKLEIK